jgi:hypothetical protein
MALLFECLTLSPTRQSVTPASDGGYSGGNATERGMSCSAHSSGRDKRPLAIKLKKSRQGTCYERKITNTVKDQRPQPKDVT